MEFAGLLSEFVFVFVLVVIFFNNIEFDGIEADDLQIGSALFTRENIALVRVGIDMDIGIALGTCSGRHLPYLQMEFIE